MRGIVPVSAATPIQNYETPPYEVLTASKVWEGQPGSILEFRGDFSGATVQDNGCGPTMVIESGDFWTIPKQGKVKINFGAGVGIRVYEWSWEMAQIRASSGRFVTAPSAARADDTFAGATALAGGATAQILGSAAQTDIVIYSPSTNPAAGILISYINPPPAIIGAGASELFEVGSFIEFRGVLYATNQDGAVTAYIHTKVLGA